VVDNGAASFIPLSNYLIENSAIDMTLAPVSRRSPPVVTGGQVLLDTLDGFAQLAKQMPDSARIVWLNEYFGATEADGSGSRT
jgi:hypothetical protein